MNYCELCDTEITGKQKYCSRCKVFARRESWYKSSCKRRGVEYVPRGLDWYRAADVRRGVPPPPPPKRKHKKSFKSIGEVVKAADALGMSYGEYVSKFL